MEQDVAYENRGAGKTVYPWLINMQHPVANMLNRSLAIPATGLHQFDVSPPAKICPVVIIADQRCIALTHMMAGISLKDMGSPVQDLHACSSDSAMRLIFCSTGTEA